MQGLAELHPRLRVAWEFVDTVRYDLLDTIRPLTRAQWTFRPEAASWGIAEVVAHLLHAEIGSSKMVRKLIRGDYRDQAVPSGAVLHTVDLDRYPYGRLEAPPNLLPGPLRDRAELIQELEVAHARFRTELRRFHGEDPETLCSPDPATRVWYTLGGWVKLHAWHEAHHIAQITGLIAARGFPR